MYTFIQQGPNKFIESDSDDFYILTKQRNVFKA